MVTPKISALRTVFYLSDFALMNICLFVSYHFFMKLGYKIDHTNLLILFPISCVTWLTSSFLFRLYSKYTVYKLQDINNATWRSIILHVVLLLVFSFSVNESSNFHLFIFLYSGLLIVSFFFSRLLCFILKPFLNFNFEERNAKILAIASIGGHWIELLRLMSLFEGKDVTFISNKESLKESVNGHKFYTVPDANRDDKFNLIKCIAKVFGCILFIRPQVIITTGAAPGLLGILVGRILGIKTIWIDSVANVEKLSLSGNIATLLADRVYTQWEHLANKRVTFGGNVL